MDAFTYEVSEKIALPLDVQATEILIVSTVYSFSAGIVGPPKRFQ